MTSRRTWPTSRLHKNQKIIQSFQDASHRFNIFCPPWTHQPLTGLTYSSTSTSISTPLILHHHIHQISTLGIKCSWLQSLPPYRYALLRKWNCNCASNMQSYWGTFGGQQLLDGFHTGLVLDIVNLMNRLNNGEIVLDEDTFQLCNCIQHPPNHAPHLQLDD